MSLSRNKKYFLILSLFFFLSFSGEAEAAILYFSPSSGSYSVGNILNVNVLVNTQNASINNADAVINFPVALLEVVSISKSGSIFTLWVEEPFFSNSSGLISFNGGLPTPGYNGGAGKLINITFRIRNPGTASLVFPSGAVRANDGYGTNVLGVLGTASFSFALSEPVVPVPTPTPIPVVIPSEEPPAPTVIDLNEIKSPEEPAPETIGFQIPSSRVIYEWSLGLMFLIILLLVIFLFFTRTKKKDASHINILRKIMRKDLHDIDRIVEKSFDLLKEDVNDAIHVLEQGKAHGTRTDEESTTIRHLRQNLIDAERIIHKQVLNAEKEIEE